MNKATLTISVLTLGMGVLFITAQNALAYKGDPNIVGPNCTQEKYQAVQNAIKNRDYNTWKNLMGDRGITRKITEQNFSRFAEMVKLRFEGKIDEANKIRTELGFGLRNGAGVSQKMNMGRNWNR